MLRGSRPSESCSINRRLDTWRRITGDRVKRRGTEGVEGLKAEKTKMKGRKKGKRREEEEWTEFERRKRIS